MTTYIQEQRKYLGFHGRPELCNVYGVADIKCRRTYPKPAKFGRLHVMRSVLLDYFQSVHCPGEIGFDLFL